MSLPIYLFNKAIVGLTSSVSGSMLANITSVPVNIQEASGFCIQASYTGSPVGSIEVQASNDPINIGYTTIPTSVTAITGAGSYMLNVDIANFAYVQLVYTFTSGTGTMAASCSAKRK